MQTNSFSVSQTYSLSSTLFPIPDRKGYMVKAVFNENTMIKKLQKFFGPQSTKFTALSKECLCTLCS